MSRLAELGTIDVTTEEGYRDFTRKATQVVRDLRGELETVSAMMGTVLAVTPTNDESTDSRREARKVRGYLRRAALAQAWSSGQIAGAFRLTERVFFPKKARRQAGMRMTGRRSA